LECHSVHPKNIEVSTRRLAFCVIESKLHDSSAIADDLELATPILSAKVADTMCPPASKVEMQPSRCKRYVRRFNIIHMLQACFIRLQLRRLWRHIPKATAAFIQYGCVQLTVRPEKGSHSIKTNRVGTTNFPKDSHSWPDGSWESRGRQYH
jgi:hypothetical protein